MIPYELIADKKCPLCGGTRCLSRGKQIHRDVLGRGAVYCSNCKDAFDGFKIWPEIEDVPPSGGRIEMSKMDNVSNAIWRLT
jgi:predicted metal-binding protein